MKGYNDLEQYKLPDNNPVVIKFSGGRSSGLMLLNILKAYKFKLPDHVIVIFNNTGAEHPATLDFVNEFEKRYGVDIHWLEYYRDESRQGVKGDPKNLTRRVDYKTASRNMEPFRELFNKHRILPNQSLRLCTSELKIKAGQRYLLNVLKLDKYFTCLGYRGDELNRVKKTDRDIENKENTKELGAIYPLAIDQISSEYVQEFWKQMDFDLGIPSYLGNCVFCFLKGRQKLQYIAKYFGQDESLNLKHWVNIENTRIRETRYIDATFIKGIRYKDLDGQQDLVYDIEQDSGGIDCLCTD